MLRESEPRLPRCALERDYGAALVLDGGRVAVNFVSTLDGIVSFGLDGADSRAVSGGSIADRTVMAMLRALAGVILIGAGTLRATQRHQWTPPALLPGREAELHELRAAAGRPAAWAPLLVVSATGRLPADADAVARPAVPLEVITAGGIVSPVEAAAEHDGAGTHLDGAGTRLDGARIVAAARARAGEGPVLCEGGPTLLGSLLEAAVPIDLFLTLAPQLAGRRLSGRSPSTETLTTMDTRDRHSLVEGLALPPFARHGTLRSIRAAGDHLLLRYSIDAATE